MKPNTSAKRRLPTQQETERRHFEMFGKAYSLPPGTIRYGDKPDVVLLGAQKIGIEITDFYRKDGSCPESEQVQQRRRVAAVPKAQRLYEQATGKNFQLQFGFNKNHPIQDADELAQRIANLGRRVEGGDNGQISKGLYQDIPELESVHLHARELVYPPYVDPEFPKGQPDHSEGYTVWATYRNRREAHARREGIYRPLSFTAVWNMCQGHDFGPMSTTRLAEIVRAKEAKANTMRLAMIIGFSSS